MGCTSGSLVWIVVVKTKRVSQDSCKPKGSQFPRVLQAGQVWFPDFPQYTIQALIDFSKEGLSLIIQETWRRFPSGLHVVGRFSWKYQKLVFVFIPTRGKLDGGAGGQQN
jgi:hypothetical protein